MEGQTLDLKPDTISLLTKKIEANLKNGHGKNAREKAQLSGKNGRKESSQKGTAQSNLVSKKNKSQGKSAEADPQNPILRGKKRLRDGRLKVSSHLKPGFDGADKGTKKSLGGTDSSLDLEKEILALGGSKDDLKLIEDATSGSEIDGDAPGSKKPALNGLEKELRRYVKELGIDEVSQELDEDPTLELEEEEPAVENKADKETASTRSAKAGMIPSQLVCAIMLAPLMVLRTIANASPASRARTGVVCYSYPAHCLCKFEDDSTAFRSGISGARVRKVIAQRGEYAVPSADWVGKFRSAVLLNHHECWYIVR